MASVKMLAGKGSVHGSKGGKDIKKYSIKHANQLQRYTPPHALLTAIMLFCSGLAGLVYQIIWIRELTLVVGVEVYSITIAVSGFFAGLALGSALLGSLSDRWRSPLRFYALLELCIAIASVTTTILLAHAGEPFATIQARAGILAWGLPILLVAIPATLMGGTLPIITRWLTQQSDAVAQAGGWAYAVNTAGAIAGALASSFVLLPWLGVRSTSYVVACINIIAACIALALGRHTQTKFAAQVANPSAQIKSWSALALYAFVGCIALGYEVVWSQLMAQFLSTRVFAFSIVLATYLAGLVIGSAFFVRFAHKIRDTWGIFALLITSAGTIALLEISLLSVWQLRVQYSLGSMAYFATSSEFARMCMQFFVAAIGIVLIPTALLGAAFPAILRLTADGKHAGRDVGTVLAMNTAGGIIGILLTGFLLIPTLGVIRTLSVLGIAAAMAGAFAAFPNKRASSNTRWAVLIFGAITIAAGLLTSTDRLSRLLLTTRGGGELIYYREGRGATVAVAQQQSGDNIFRRLYIQGVSNSGDAMPSLRYMRLQAMLPLLIHRGEPKSAMVIGFGTGITAGAILHYPGLERRVCVELLPAVVHAAELFPENYKAATDPQMQIRIGDGRQELLRSNDRYDLITLEPPPPSAEGVVNLYSTDFYKLAGRRLEPNGLFAQWLPLATQNNQDTKSLVQSFLNVFPYATLWTTELHEMLLIGSFSPIELNAKEITSRFQQKNVSTALQAVGIDSPAALLATWVADRGGMEQYAAHARPVTDDDPRIEYSAWVHPKEIVNTLPDLLAVRTEMPLYSSDDAFNAEIIRQRQILMDFYSAGIAAYNRDQEGWGAAMQRVMTLDGSNAYYRWIAGRGEE